MDTICSHPSITLIDHGTTAREVAPSQPLWRSSQASSHCRQNMRDSVGIQGKRRSSSLGSRTDGLHGILPNQHWSLALMAHALPMDAGGPCLPELDGRRRRRHKSMNRLPPPSPPQLGYHHQLRRCNGRVTSPGREK
jgi:hypothetical protein